jgi:hypothetical protein
MQLSIYLCTFSSTCFGLTRPSSGAIDVTISLHMQHMVPWCGEVSILRSVCVGGVLHCSASWACKPETCRAENTLINTQLHQVGKLIHIYVEVQLCFK